MQKKLITPKKNLRARLIFTLALATFITQASIAQRSLSIDRVEPPFWWVGMVHPQVQLMVHGQEISALKPSIEYAGVVLSETIQVENPNYLFLTLSISPQTKPGDLEIKFLKNGKPKLVHKYTLKSRVQGSAQRQGFSNQDIIYLITPDRFANGDPSNDTVAGLREKADRSHKLGRHGGDIAGLEQQLGYFEDMGFTALWINPLLENDMPQYSYHGYATTDFYNIDPRFGTNEAYRAFSAQAKKQGIKVIKDMIVNHCGTQHWWIGDEPTRDWLNYQQASEKPITNHKRTTLVDPYATESDKQSHARGWFVPSMPDLNQKNALLAEYLIQNSIWWVEYAGLSGIRQDTYPYPDADFMSEWSCRIMQEYPNFNIVGEEWSENPALIARWQQGNPRGGDGKSCLPSLFDFPLQVALVEALNKKPAPYSDSFNGVYEMLGNDFLYPNPYNLVSFLDNHDMARVYNQVNEDFRLFKMAMVYLFTVRGIPQVYYGTEVLLNNAANPDDHGLLREDMPGGWSGDPASAFTGVGLSPQQKEAKAIVKTLARFRRDTPALHHGGLKHFAPKDEVYVMFRIGKSAKVMAVFNKNSEPVTLNVEAYREVLGEAKKAKSVLGNKAYSLGDDPIVVQGLSAALFLVQ